MDRSEIEEDKIREKATLRCKLFVLPLVCVVGRCINELSSVFKTCPGPNAMICSRTNFPKSTWKEIRDKRIKLVSRQKIESNGGMIHHLTGNYHPSYASRFEGHA